MSARAGGLGPAIAVVLCCARAWAVPGPDSVVVVANENLPESVALAERYARAREVPRSQVCSLDLPAGHDLTLTEYQQRFEAPLVACLTASAAIDRIEAAVLVRGVPLRVSIPLANGSERVSLAAALGVWTSSAGGQRLLGQPPGAALMCGQVPCFAARWSNPYRSGAFEAGWSRTSRGVTWRPLLVTMLHGRTTEHAARLIDSAIGGERAGGARGTFLFMNGADPARGVLDATYDSVIQGLIGRGFTAERASFDPDATGRTLAAFFTGTAGIGRTIEGNSFLPGAIADNVTSFGAVPENFEAAGETQVSIARWVAAGVAGVHGTTDEPLNNCFPSRDLILAYVDGFTLAEAFHQKMPFVYWRNLVLGDPMAAPYATRPTVTIEGVTEGERVLGSRRVTVRAEDPLARGISRVLLFADGFEVARVEGDTSIERCVDVPVREDVQLLAVAQAADDGSPAGRARSKGWAAVHVRGEPGPSGCVPTPALDAGVSDGGLVAGDAGAHDAGRSPAGDGGPGAAPDAAEKAFAEPEGCACGTSGRETAPFGASLLLSLLLVARLRARRLGA